VVDVTRPVSDFSLLEIDALSRRQCFDVDTVDMRPLYKPLQEEVKVNRGELENPGSPGKGH